MIGVGTCNISPNGKKYVNQVLDTGRLSYGPFIQKFERVFSASHQSRYGIMTASGTCSLMIALAALKNKYNWQDGDEVIVPAVTFIATSNVVLQLNMKPIFVDVEPIYYELDPTKIEAAITPRTRCIIPVHLFGCPCDMDPIMNIAKKHDLRIIEDSCETMFIKYKGKSVGSFGDVGCFSTYVAHILITGVGGLCTTNHPDLAVDLRSLMNHGRDSIYISIDDDKDKSGDEFDLIIKKRFSFVQMGYSFRVTEMEGALGLAEYEIKDEMMKLRFENGKYFMNKLSHLSAHLQLPTLRPDSGHAFMMFPIVMKNEKKDEIVKFLEKRGIETRDMLPLINQPFYKELLKINEDDFPVAKWINENGFYIGSHQNLTTADKEYIVKIFNEYFSGDKANEEKNCLIILSKTGQGTEQLQLESFYDSLILDDFHDRILVDSSLDDKVRTFFEKKGFLVVKTDDGKGNSLFTGLEKTDSNNIVVMEIDGSDDPNHLNEILINLKRGNDLVIASRFIAGGGREADSSLVSYRSLGNRFFTFLLSIVYDKNVTDCNNTFRGFKKNKITSLGLSEEGDAVFFEMTLRGLANNLSLVEIPTIEKHSYIPVDKENRFFSAALFMFIMFKQLFRK